MRYAGPRTGTGRPRKWDEPTIHVSMRLPYSVLQQIDEMTRPGISRTDVIVSLVQAASNAEVAKYILRIKELEMTLKQEREEKQALLNALDRERQARERAEKEAEAWKQKYYELKGEKPAHSYNEGKLLRMLAEHAREGVSWADLCAEVLDLRDEKKMKRLMQLAFNVKTTGRNTYATEFYPKRTAPEFKGWVLKRPEREGPVLLIDYELYREDTLKAAKGLAVGEAVAEKVPEVKPLKSGPAAERWIEITLEVIYHEYMEFIGARQGKRAKEFIEVEAQSRIERTLEAVDPADARRAAFAVLEKHEADWNEAFISNMRRVLTRILNTGHYARPLEVKADVPVEACDL